MKASPLADGLALCLAALALSGCTDVSSTNLKTAGIDAYFSVTATGTGNTYASAEFSVDGSALTYVELKPGDQVTATVGGQTKTLEETKTLGIITYDATFSGADAEGSDYAFTLARDSDTSAPNNGATLPAAFSITAPSGSALSYSRASDDIVVSYDNAQQSDPMSYTLSGDCVDIVSQALAGDTGSFTIPKGTLTERAGTASSCQVILTVFRTRMGTVDGAFAGGSSSGIQARSVVFTSNP